MAMTTKNEKIYYKLENCQKEWKNFLKMYETIEHACSLLSNETLSQIYRFFFFLTYAEYKKEFKFNRAVQHSIELIVSQRNFDFFEEKPVEVKDAIIKKISLEE